MTSRRDLLLALFFLSSSLAYQPVLAREDRWDDDDDDDDLCIDITVTGESDQCTVSGAGCGKTKGIYTVSVSSKDPSNYSPEWSSKKYTLVDKSVSDTVSCDKIDPGEACYNIIIKGDTENCPYELTPPNCKREGEATKYTNGTYKLTVSPKEGFFFQMH